LSFEQVLAFIPQTPRFLFVPNELEENESTDKMIDNLIQQSVQSQDGKIPQKIKDIRKVLNLEENLHSYLKAIGISGFIMEKLDSEYYESEKHSQLSGNED
jgi:hypothetical protein